MVTKKKNKKHKQREICAILHGLKTELIKTTAQLATIAIKSRGSGNISRLNTRTAKEREVIITKMDHLCKGFMISLQI